MEYFNVVIHFLYPPNTLEGMYFKGDNMNTSMEFFLTENKLLLPEIFSIESILLERRCV